MVWNIGNTTVRNPNRIQEGLQLFKGEFSGNADGKSRESVFWNKLIDSGVVRETATKNQDINGRKWRSCFVKLGFIAGKKYSVVNDKIVHLADIREALPDLTGLPYEITPVGIRLANAQTQAEIENIFLRQLLRLEVYSPTENPKEKHCKLKPLILILQVLSELEAAGEVPGLSNLEIAAFIQTQTDHNEIDKMISKIARYRKARETKSGKNIKKRYDEEILRSNTSSFQQKSETFSDYADTTTRYCRLTGLFSLRKNRIFIQEDKKPLVQEILKREPSFLAQSSPLEYLIDFYLGTKLPTDDRAIALQQIKIYIQRISEHNHIPEFTLQQVENCDVKEMTDAAFQLQEQYRSIIESEFAQKHYDDPNEIDILVRYLQELSKNKKHFDDELEIDDAPSYLEWSVWRSLLCFNHLVVAPSRTRRFNIDMDMRPTSHAPGGDADIIMEYVDFTLVTEVTLLSGSRQEAAEGEPVRRHVAKVANLSSKDVLGLFIAPQIDFNTAETFRVGSWYEKQQQTHVEIVPITITQLLKVMLKFKNIQRHPSHLRKLLEMCLSTRSQLDAPNWLQEIDRCIESWVPDQIIN